MTEYTLRFLYQLDYPEDHYRTRFVWWAGTDYYNPEWQHLLMIVAVPKRTQLRDSYSLQEALDKLDRYEHLILFSKTKGGVAVSPPDNLEGKPLALRGFSIEEADDEGEILIRFYHPNGRTMEEVIITTEQAEDLARELNDFIDHDPSVTRTNRQKIVGYHEEVK